MLAVAVAREVPKGDHADGRRRPAPRHIKAMGDAKSGKAAIEENTAPADGDSTQPCLVYSQEELETVRSTCMQTASAYEAPVYASTEESTGIAKAAQKLEETTSGAAQQNYSLVQIGVRMRIRADLGRSEVVTMKKPLANKYYLVAVAQLASKMDKTRQETQAGFAKAKLDLDLGLKGVWKVLVVLREYFYGGPEDASFRLHLAKLVKQSKVSGIGLNSIGILDGCDLAKNLDTDETEEEDVQSSYSKNANSLVEERRIAAEFLGDQTKGGCKADE